MSTTDKETVDAACQKEVDLAVELLFEHLDLKIRWKSAPSNTQFFQLGEKLRELIARVDFYQKKQKCFLTFNAHDRSGLEKVRKRLWALRRDILLFSIGEMVCYFEDIETLNCSM